MSKSRIELLREYQLRQESERLAQAVIDKAAGPPSSQVVEIPCCLATRYDMLDGLPLGARICKMPDDVAKSLAADGFCEPVSLKALPSKWWWVRQDAASERDIEPGSACLERAVSSEQLARVRALYYAEVVSGPFATREDVLAVYGEAGE